MKKEKNLKFTETTRQMPNKGKSKQENNGYDGDKRTNPKRKQK